MLRLRRRRLLRRGCCLGCGLVFIYLFITILMLYLDNKCSNEESEAILLSLCEAYSRDDVEGNLCKALCEDHQIKYKMCKNYKEGKKIIVADWTDKQIILKSKKAFIKEYDSIGFAVKSLAEENMPSEREFVRMVADSVKFNLNVAVAEDSSVLSKVWFLDFKQFLANPVSKKAAMQSIWSLVQQDEYLLMKVLEGNKYIPTLHGTCGHFYAMEYLPPGGLLDTGFSSLTRLQHDASWKDHVILAVFILELLKSFEEEFHEILHICDIKGENFGLTPDGSVKLIDADMVFFDSKLNSLLSGIGTNCSSDEECHFFDCHSECNTINGQCLPHRNNNNLQVVCQYIFKGGLRNVYHGLLHDPPYYMKQDLSSVLEQCAHPEQSNQPKHRMVKPTFHRLYNLLTGHLYNDLLVLNTMARSSEQ